MSRVMIVGSQEFVVDVMQFALQHGVSVDVGCVVDSATDVASEVRRGRPDVVVVDGLTDHQVAFRSLPAIRAQAKDALMFVLVDGEHPVRPPPEDGVVVCSWRVGPAAPGRASSSEAGEAARSHPEGSTSDSRPDSIALTRREREILRWVADGRTNAWIARKLWVTEQTVKFHLTNTYRKLGVANRTQATRYAVRHELVTHDGGATPERASDEIAAEAKSETPVPK